MDARTYDVVIVGAGAAGCAAAAGLPEGVRGLLVDRFDAARGRCCGGLLAPDAQRAIRRLGLKVPDAVRVRPEPHEVHVLDLDSGRQQTYARDYRNLDRARFDAWLLEQARGRVDVRPHARLVDLARDAEDVTVRLSAGGTETAVRATCVIGADGAGSRARRLAFPDRPAPRAMVAIQVRLPADPPTSRHEVLFASRLTSFYAWAIPKARTVLVGAAFGRLRGARERFEEILEHFRQRLGLDGPVLARSARRLTRPARANDLFAGDGRVLLAGEAAGLVSPSSGEGLSFALESGAAAGAAVRACGPAPTASGSALEEAADAVAYHRHFDRLARRVRRKVIKARVIFSPRLRRWALRLPWCP